MPKAASARRSSGATSVTRAEPYPTSKPTESTSKKPSTKSTALKKSKVLSEKTSSEINTPASTESQGSFLDIHLEGEDTDSVPLYDTCSTIRQKINALLGKDNAKPENGNPQELDKKGNRKPFTKASFLRAIGGGQSNGLSRFLKAKQKMGGAENQVYWKAYAFFEKKRIFDGKKKTATREKVEKDRPNGLARKDPNNIRVFCMAGENPRDFLDDVPDGLARRDPKNIRIFCEKGDNVGFLDEYGQAML